MKYFCFLVLIFLSFQLKAQDSVMVISSNVSVNTNQKDSINYSRFGSILTKMNITESNRFSPDYLDALENAKKSTLFSFFASTAFPVPGLGQIYNEDNMTAIIQAGGFILGYFLVVNSLNGVDRKNPYRTPFELYLAGPQILTGEVLMLGTKLWSMIDAPLTTNIRNEIIDKKIKNYKYIRKTLFPDNQNIKIEEK